jgi:hypothetical protein
MTIAPMVLLIVGGTAPGFMVESESAGHKREDGGYNVRRTGASRRTCGVERKEKRSAVGEAKRTKAEMRTYAVLYVPFAPESLKRTVRSTWEGGSGSQISDNISVCRFQSNSDFFPDKKKEMPIGTDYPRYGP